MSASMRKFRQSCELNSGSPVSASIDAEFAEIIVVASSVLVLTARSRTGRHRPEYQKADLAFLTCADFNLSNPRLCVL